jgi:5-methylcytosine-specific restriction protein A
VRDGLTYCDRHRRVRQQEHDAQRGSATQRGYGSRWQKARTTFLASNPLCVEHLRRHQYVAATVVDHIVPHRGDQALFWDSSNWQALCNTCHVSWKARIERRAPA